MTNKQIRPIEWQFTLINLDFGGVYGAQGPGLDPDLGI